MRRLWHEWVMNNGGSFDDDAHECDDHPHHRRRHLHDDAGLYTSSCSDFDFNSTGHSNLAASSAYCPHLRTPAASLPPKFCNARAGYRLHCLLPRLRANGRFTGLFKTTSVAESSCCFLPNRRNIWPISVLLCARAAATATTTPSATQRVKPRAVVTLGTPSCCA